MSIGKQDTPTIIMALAAQSPAFDREKAAECIDKAMKGKTLAESGEPIENVPVEDQKEISNRMLNLLHYQQFCMLANVVLNSLKSQTAETFKKQLKQLKKDTELTRSEPFKILVMYLAYTKADGDNDKAMKMIKVSVDIVRKEWILAGLLKDSNVE